jgi:hypothetical protein
MFLLLLSIPGWGAEQPGTTSADEHTLRLGEKIYREGLLPSGKPMKVLINADVSTPGTAFGCVSCHLRSGIGSEDQVLVPPANGLKLYKPYYQYPTPQNETYGRIKKGMWDGRAPGNPIHRPAYTDETLAAALRNGVDPTGRALNGAMPRYQIDDHDMAILIAYLKSLSSEISPGVDKNNKYIRFATVIAGDVPAEERAEMLATLDSIMAHHNRQGQIRNRYQKIGDENKPVPFNYPTFTLTTWQLNGPANTWRAQLEEYYRKEPVFALLGGLSATDWQPIHEFSEQNKIPCLLPITDLPVISDTDWYTLYFSKGVYQEGESTARYLELNSDVSAGTSILQIVEDSPRARALATSFLETWKELGRTAPESVYLPAGETINAAKIHTLNEQNHPAAILLWTASGTIPALEALSAEKEAVKMVFVSSTLLKQDLWNLPEKARNFTYISYPYRLDKVTDLFSNNARNWIKQRNIPDSGNRISTRLYSLTNVLLEPFKVVKRDFNPAGLGKGNVIMEEQFESLLHVKRNYYRDYLLDVIGMYRNRPSIDYERLSFGPGQRYVSKECYIAQLSPGPKPELIRKSDLVTQ